MSAYQWFKIAYRNLLRNRRRSIVTVSAIAFGYAAICIFNGYTSATFDSLRNGVIHGGGIGHLTIYKKGWSSEGKLNIEKYLFSAEEVASIRETLHKHAQIKLIAPELAISGLISNGSQSTIFIANGVVPELSQTIKGEWAARTLPKSGTQITSSNKTGVELSEGLAASLKIGVGDWTSVMATTMDGQMNALDGEVLGIYDTGAAETNDKQIKVPLDYAQSLYDTKGVDKIRVLLGDWTYTEKMRLVISDELQRIGIATEIESWDQLSSYYRQVRNMFEMIFLFIISIVIVIVLMSVINTINMTVMERSREIGTLRALGLTKSGVTKLFATEGILIGFVGAMSGFLLYVLTYVAVLLIEPTYTPPSFSSPVPLLVKFVPMTSSLVLLLTLVIACAAAYISARGRANIKVASLLIET